MDGEISSALVKVLLMENKIAFVLDFDGVFTDAKMYYTKDGKFMKSVGCDDWSLIKELSRHIPVSIISADKRGFDITKKRIVEEMNMELTLVRGSGKERWEWIKNKYPDHFIIFMGDSLSDCYSLRQANIAITVEDALKITKECSNVIIGRRGGNRAVAEAVLYINDYFKIFDLDKFIEEN